MQTETRHEPEITVSVLLPVRDARGTLPEALDSVCRQHGLDNDLEILVADDGSQDGSAKIAHDLASRDARVRVLELPRLGLVPALNAALTAARGRFIARMDADDRSAPDRLTRQLRHITRHPRLDVVGTRVRLFPENTVSPNMDAYVRWQNRLLSHRAMERNLLVECPLTHPTALFHRKALSDLGGWRDIDAPEDMDLWLRGARAGWRFGKVNRTLYDWRESRHRLSRTDPRYSREAFRRLAMEACLGALGSNTEVVLWGWGRSLEVWSQGLATGGIRLETMPVNPRDVRAGALPVLPRDSCGVHFRHPGTQSGRVWLLAYGSERSRNTLDGRLRDRGLRPGVHYRFVS